jgi:penicillin-binding protein 1C
MLKPLRKLISLFKYYLEKPREYIFRIPFLRRLPRRVQTFLYYTFSPTILILAVLVYFYWGLPLPNQLTSDTRNPVSTQILDRNGKLIYEIFEEKRRTPIKIEELPPYISQATISIEDKDFYKHHGISITGIGRALFAIVTRQHLEGGSTISQQLVKTTLLTPDRTIRRKVREITLTLIIETLYPKDKILEMYLNNVPYGGTAWGIEAASQTYFGKPAKDLNLAQASLLAGLPASPTRLSPYGSHPELAKERQKLVLGRMVEDGYITPEQRDQAIAEPISYVRRGGGINAPHFALYVKERLVDKYGESMVEHGGLRVTTTLDLDIQNHAQQVVKDEVDKLKKANVGNGAAMVTDPKTGEIYAMVGSKDYFADDEDGEVNITLAHRQPGSSIKPLNYALGLLDGKITAATPLADVPTCFTLSGQAPYCPDNYDGSFHGAVQARFALGNSYNVPAVRVLALNGVSHFIDFARDLGITTFEDPSNYGLSLTLGGGEIRMIDMVEAYGVFANQGIKQEPISILEVKDWTGKVIDKTKIKDGDRILPAGVSFIISHILYDNNARTAVFGTSSYLNVSGHSEVSVKTGTTNDKRDNWTIGYTPEVVVATWVGNNDNEAMNAVASGVSGASPIWNRIIKYALDKIENGDLGSSGQAPGKHTHVYPSQPSDVVGTNVCATTGALPPNGDNPDDPGCPTRYEYFLEDNPAPSTNSLTENVAVMRDTDMLAKPDTPADILDMKDKQIITDPLGTRVCLDCGTPQNWSVTINPLNISGAYNGLKENQSHTLPYGGR